MKKYIFLVLSFYASTAVGSEEQIPAMGTPLVYLDTKTQDTHDNQNLLDMVRKRSRRTLDFGVIDNEDVPNPPSQQNNSFNHFDPNASVNYVADFGTGITTCYYIKRKKAQGLSKKPKKTHILQENNNQEPDNNDNK